MTVKLADVIAEVESGKRDSAIRFEAGLYKAWTAAPTPARDAIIREIVEIHDCSADTARMIACTSWGRYQLLGENLYSAFARCSVNVFTFVEVPDVQAQCLALFLTMKGINFTLENIIENQTMRENFIIGYNGPGAVDAYWQRMKAAVAKLGV